MIIIALGANLPSSYGVPAQTLKAAVEALEAHGVKVIKRSRVWITAPVPFDPDIPAYHNGVVSVETSLTPHDLLSLMLSIEAEFGRVRSVKNAPRLLDLDLIAYNDEVIKDEEKLIVPHPRMHERAFVLKPLEQIDKAWTHPVSGQNLSDLIHDLPGGQEAIVLDGAAL